MVRQEVPWFLSSGTQVACMRLQGHMLVHRTGRVLSNEEPLEATAQTFCSKVTNHKWIPSFWPRRARKANSTLQTIARHICKRMALQTPHWFIERPLQKQQEENRTQEIRICVAGLLSSNLVAISRCQLWPTPTYHELSDYNMAQKEGKLRNLGRWLSCQCTSYHTGMKSSYSQKSPQWWLLPVTQNCGEKAENSVSWQVSLAK